MKRLVKAVLLMALVVPISHCRMINDPDVSLLDRDRTEEVVSARHRACTRICDRIHAKAQEEELELHKEILVKCMPLPWEQEEVCRDAEHERYRQAKRAIEEQKSTCKFACRYGEGSGDGGR